MLDKFILRKHWAKQPHKITTPTSFLGMIGVYSGSFTTNFTVNMLKVCFLIPMELRIMNG